ncbi:class III lanthionine synthetase LanKC [Streptomyces sp. NPDC002564]|uniref:class III lanthionine synthetase LanKC n=1 Tax=Streptomyces sp. NPDC002564 TaxID=3364649 RepID=UPI003688DD9F
MNEGYAVFCDADRQFYDAPYRVAEDGHGGRGLYAPLRQPLPEGWQQRRVGDWMAFTPAYVALPSQGWKIHISATLDNAESILARVWDYCVPRSIAFKCMPNRYLLHTRNAKYGDRGSSGKFITIYPADDEQCRTVSESLDRLLGGEPGPYILTDLRYGSGPVYLRYGSFTVRNCYDEEGQLRPAIEDANGRLVPDRRDPTFYIPPWLTLPDFLEPHLAARSDQTVAEIPYRFDRALHFSNGGGVYLATDTRTDEKVVIKEGRPHAGLAADGADAVTRLERERDALVRLSGLSCTPEVHDWFAVDDHRFLVLEFVEGRPLNRFFAHRHPLIEPDPTPQVLADYTDWAIRVHGLVAEAVADIHARGVVFNDLHLFNIMLSEDEASVVLLDFEAASVDDATSRQVVANPGFVAPPERRGPDVDTYALACLRIALFLPLTSLFTVDRAKAAHLAEIAAAQFPVPRAFLDEAVEEITRGYTAPHRPTTPGSFATGDDGYLPVRLGDWPRSRDSMAAALLASATPHREDRCFPGDIAQFTVEGGGSCFAYGAAGVLYSLAETGAAPVPEAEEWLLRATKTPASGTPLGFYDGLSGIAWVLERLGHRARALDLVDLLVRQDWDTIGPDLHGGLAGIGLALDSLATSTGERDLHERALRCAQLAADAGKPAPSGAPRATARAGLLHGASGTALLYIRLYESTKDATLLDLAADALRRDLARCKRAVGGALQVDEGRRTLPYLGAGSVGIGMVLDDYLALRDDEQFEQARVGIVEAAQAKFYAQPNLFRGAAGMVMHLARTTTGGPGTHTADLDRQIESLSWGAVPYQGHLAFAGEQMMRLSMDLSSGTAGCLLALGSALHGTPVHLPFLPPLARPQNRPPFSETEAKPRSHK